MPVRNEDWILGFSARAALMWCDVLVVMLHRCSDRSNEIIEDIREEHDCLGSIVERPNSERRVIVLRDFALEWEEMRMRQRLLEIGRELGGTHFALIDADEVLTGNLLPGIRSFAETTDRNSILMLPWLQMMEAPGVSLVCSRVMSSGMWGEQNASTVFPDQPCYHWATRDGYDLHHRHPMGAELRWDQPISDRSGGLMHFQFASRRRLLAKQLLYQLIEMKRWPGRRPVDAVRHMYARTVQESESAALSSVPDSWWAPYSHLLKHLHIDAEPWQEAECKRLLADNPKLAVGLDDFGLMKEWGL